MALPEWFDSYSSWVVFAAVSYIAVALRPKGARDAPRDADVDRGAERRARRWRHWASVREWSLSENGKVLTGRIEPFSATLRLSSEGRGALELQGTVSLGAPRVCRRGDDAAFDAMFEAARVSRVEVMDRGLVLVLDEIDPEDMEELLDAIDRFARAHTGGYRG